VTYAERHARRLEAALESSMPIKVLMEPGYERLPRFLWSEDDPAYAVLEAYGIVNEVTAGENVVDQDQTSDALYLVLEGELAVLRDGKEVARLTKHLSFGEMGLLLRQRRTATVRAIVDSRVLELGQADLDRMLVEEPARAAVLYRTLAECLAEYLTQSASPA